jgi:hypothetical protein
MIIKNQAPVIESSGDMKEISYGVGDLGFIFDILRNKLYADPILAVCREYTCNARDAHREVGTPDLPITISLPNYLDSNYRIKDQGPGISPDRIENIFVKYASSTKREDNTQTGAWGIGSKCAFSICQSFTIETIVNNVKYNYVCYIDETKVGKLSLMGKEMTDLPNGTEIIIPVQEKDIRAFKEGTEFVTRHWSVKPIINGDGVSFVEPKVVLSGTDWSIIKDDRYQGSLYYNGIKAIVDGIEYPIQYEALKNFYDIKFIDRISGSIFLYFGIGELSLAANRETIQIDEDTKNAISKKIDVIAAELNKKIQDKVETAPNYWQAHIVLNNEIAKIFQYSDRLQNLNWKSLPVTPNKLDLHLDPLNPAYGHYTSATELTVYRLYLNDKNVYNRKLKKHVSVNKVQYLNNYNSLHFDPNLIKLIINDLPVETYNQDFFDLFESFLTGKESIQLICLKDQSNNQKIIDNYHLNEMSVIKLSEVINLDVLNKKEAKSLSKPKLLIYKLNSSFDLVSIDSLKDDANKKIICKLLRNAYDKGSPSVSIKNVEGDKLRSNALKCLLKNNISIYGVYTDDAFGRFQKEFPEAVSLDTYLEDTFKDQSTIDLFVLQKYCMHVYSSVSSRNLYASQNIRHLINDQDSLSLKYLNLKDQIYKHHDLIMNNESLISLYEATVKEISKQNLDDFIALHPEMDIKAINKSMDEKYPLLRLIDSYYDEKTQKHLISYINLIDKESKNNE